MSEQNPNPLITGDGMTPAEIEMMLAGWIETHVKNYQPGEQTSFIKQPGHKWRASSAWQKSIRRGDIAAALKFAHGLHGLDPQYVWRRLPVIALEDIGLANPQLVAAVLWAAGKKVWREKHGGGEVPVLYWLVEQLCTSVKDRSVCDLVVWADSAPEFADARAGFCEYAQTPGGRNALALIAGDPDSFLGHRMLAAWALAGTNGFPGENMPKISGSFGLMMQAVESMGLPPLVKLIMKWGAMRMRDALPIAVPFVWELVAKSFAEMTIATRHETLVNLPKIGNYPSAAFDWHCQEGKRALALFNRVCKPIGELLGECGIPEDDKKARMLATSSLLFRVEGSQVDRRMMFEGAQDLIDLAEMALNRSCGIRGELNDGAMALMAANMDVMHWCRLKVLDQLPPVGPWLPKPADTAVPWPPSDQPLHLSVMLGQAELKESPHSIPKAAMKLKIKPMRPRPDVALGE